MEKPPPTLEGGSFAFNGTADPSRSTVVALGILSGGASTDAPRHR